MPSLCYECGVQVDALRTPGRVVGARIVPVCRDCSRAAPRPRPRPPQSTDTMEAAGELTPRPEPPPSPPLPLVAAARGRIARLAVLPAVIAIVAAALTLGWLGRGVLSSRHAQAASVVTVHTERPLLVPFVVPVQAAARAPVAPAPAPGRLARRLAANIPASATVIPIVGADHIEPSPNGFFGAERPGNRPEQCGDGHCGIDLRAALGTAVVAARGGVVAEVSRDANGRGGRWVKLDHGGGLSSHYFHLDKIREDLVSGTRVQAGENLGTVGRTGVHNSPTHLHFAVSIDGDYIDPMPFVRDARRVAMADL